MEQEPKREVIERIEKAAVRTPDGKIYARQTHEDVYAWNPQASTEGREEGFITNTGRFISREKAGEIAFKAGQTKERKNSLTSPDIFDLR